MVEGWFVPCANTRCERVQFRCGRIFWRQLWRVAGKESGYPELLESPQTSPEVPGLPRKFPSDSPEVLSLWNLTEIQWFPGVFPDFPGSSPDFPGSSRILWRSAPFSGLGTLTPSPKLTIAPHCPIKTDQNDASCAYAPQNREFVKSTWA